MDCMNKIFGYHQQKNKVEKYVGAHPIPSVSFQQDPVPLPPVLKNPSGITDPPLLLFFFSFNFLSVPYILFRPTFFPMIFTPLFFFLFLNIEIKKKYHMTFPSDLVPIRANNTASREF